MPPRETSAAASASETGADDRETVGLHTDDLAAAEARAEAARARAHELRRQAQAASSLGATDDAETDPPRPRRWRPRRPGRKALLVAAAIIVSAAASTGSGYLVWHHHQVVQRTQRSAEFATAARKAVLLMMSIDPKKAREDMQRFADETTGQFKAGVLMGGEDMVRALEQSKVVAKAAVQAVGVQSMTEDSAVVLVAAKSEITKADQAKPEVRTWRLVVDVERDGGQLKIAKIEFVP
jgi:Mce-associated membrane protein